LGPGRFKEIRPPAVIGANERKDEFTSGIQVGGNTQDPSGGDKVNEGDDTPSYADGSGGGRAFNKSTTKSGGEGKERKGLGKEKSRGGS